MVLTQIKGQKAEEEALIYLQRQGLTVVVRNYHCQFGEIDLIMRDKECLVFVEVRFRGGVLFGGGIESITRHKKLKIIRTANQYLTRYKLHGKQPLRFDVFSLDGPTLEVTWIKNAFEEGL